MVQLYNAVARGGPGIVGVRLCAIDCNAGETNESLCAAAQKNATEFFGFLFDLY